MKIQVRTNQDLQRWQQITVCRDWEGDRFLVTREGDTIIIRCNDLGATVDLQLSPVDAQTILKGLQEAI